MTDRIDGPLGRLMGNRGALVLAYAIAAVLVLAGCATSTPPAPQVVNVPVEVKVPVPVPCVKRADLPAPPRLLSNEELAALDDYRLVITLDLQRRALRDYQAQVDAVLRGCVSD